MKASSLKINTGDDHFWMFQFLLLNYWSKYRWFATCFVYIRIYLDVVTESRIDNLYNRIYRHSDYGYQKFRGKEIIW